METFTESNATTFINALKDAEYQVCSMARC